MNPLPDHILKLKSQSIVFSKFSGKWYSRDFLLAVEYQCKLYLQLLTTNKFGSLSKPSNIVLSSTLFVSTDSLEVSFSFLSENTELTQDWETDRPLMYSNLSLLWEQSKLEFPVFNSCFVLFPANLTLKTDFRGEKLLDDQKVFVQQESGVGNLVEWLLSPFTNFWSFLAHGVFLCTIKKFWSQGHKF